MYGVEVGCFLQCKYVLQTVSMSQVRNCPDLAASVVVLPIVVINMGNGKPSAA
jgi:hypothetical protein